MSERTPFQLIYDRELPAVEIYRNERYGILVFLDQHPATRGHMLVIPKEPADLYTDLSPGRALQLQTVAYYMMRHAATALATERVSLLISGYGVPHVHIHVIPSYERGDAAKFFEFERTKPTHKASRADLEAVSRELTLPPTLISQLEKDLDTLS